MRMLWRVIVACAALALASCASAPTSDPDGPILTAPDMQPKALATIAPSETPDSVAMEATADSLRPTATFAPATPTPTTTPLAGLFMGAATPPPGTLVYRVGDALGPLIVQVHMSPAAPLPVIGPGVFAPTGATPNAGGNLVLAPATNLPPGEALPTCPVPPGAPFANAANNPAVRARLGCPTGEATSLFLVAQLFQNGYMVWRDTREIFALSVAAIRTQAAQMDTFWRLPDTWNESLPANDPFLQPPDGTTQPVRGFGWAWRNNAPIRDALGWALAGEQQYQAIWQNFERGWMMTGPEGSVFALSPNDANPATTGVHFGPLSQ